MSEGLSVQSLQGVQLEELAQLKGYLGISLNKSNYFSKQRVRSYIRWSARRMNGLMIVVADHLESYNERVLKHYTPQEAVSKVTQRGKELAQGYRRAVPPGMDFPVEVCLASQLLQTDVCHRMVDDTWKVAEGCLEFRHDLEEAVKSNMDDPLDRERHRTILAGMDTLIGYMVEEIAIVLYLTCLCEECYSVALFPYQPQPVIKKVFEGGYSGLFSEVTGATPFRFIQLVNDRKDELVYG